MAITKVEKDGITYNINDSRIPQGQANKVLGTDAQGEYVLQDASSGGGTQLYKHTIDVTADGTTISDFIEIISTSNTAIQSIPEMYNNFYSYIRMVIKTDTLFQDETKCEVIAINHGTDSHADEYFFYNMGTVQQFQLKESHSITDTVTVL